MKLLTNVLLLGALATSVLANAIPDVAEEAQQADVADARRGARHSCRDGSTGEPLRSRRVFPCFASAWR